MNWNFSDSRQEPFVAAEPALADGRRVRRDGVCTASPRFAFSNRSGVAALVLATSVVLSGYVAGSWRPAPEVHDAASPDLDAVTDQIDEDILDEYAEAFTILAR